jgi:choline dehydrogenase-like flavoprotein
MNTEKSTTEQLATVTWDAIVIGTGMGGGTLGHELARLGRRVLFLEKGNADLDPRPGAIIGDYAEQTFDLARLTDAEHADHLTRAGRSAWWYEDTTPGRKPKLFQPITGSGLGGSSALYGMVTERLFPEDFTPRGNFADVGDSTVPDAWPVKYDEMVPWYQRAAGLGGGSVQGLEPVELVGRPAGHGRPDRDCLRPRRSWPTSRGCCWRTRRPRSSSRR